MTQQQTPKELPHHKIEIRVQSLKKLRTEVEISVLEASLNGYSFILIEEKEREYKGFLHPADNFHDYLKKLVNEAIEQEGGRFSLSYTRSEECHPNQGSLDGFKIERWTSFSNG